VAERVAEDVLKEAEGRRRGSNDEVQVAAEKACGVSSNESNPQREEGGEDRNNRGVGAHSTRKRVERKRKEGRKTIVTIACGGWAMAGGLVRREGQHQVT
jgi:hypothetical protein